MNAEDARNIAQTAQALLIGAGVIVGALWALFRIRAYGELEIAKAQLKRLQHEANAKKGISGSIDVEIHPNENETYTIIVEVCIENNGTNMYSLNFENSPFRFSEVTAEAPGDYFVTQIQHRDVVGANVEGYGSSRILGHDIMPGTVCRFPTCFKAPEKGVYLVSFVFETPVSIKQYDHDTIEHDIAITQSKKLSEDLAETKWYTRFEKLLYVGSPETKAQSYFPIEANRETDVP
jgi:hypothetical protein